MPRGPPYVVDDRLARGAVGRRAPGPSTTTTSPLRLPAQRARAGPDGLVGLGAQHAVDDQRLEPGVPGAAHLGGPGVDLGGGERDLSGVAHDRVAHRGGVGRADRLGDVVLDHLDGQPHHLDRLVEAHNPGEGPRGGAEHLGSDGEELPSGSSYHDDEGPDAGLHDEPDPGAVLGGELAEPRHVALHARHRRGGQRADGALQPAGDGLAVAGSLRRAGHGAEPSPASSAVRRSRPGGRGDRPPAAATAGRCGAGCASGPGGTSPRGRVRMNSSTIFTKRCGWSLCGKWPAFGDHLDGGAGGVLGRDAGVPHRDHRVVGAPDDAHRHRLGEVGAVTIVTIWPRQSTTAETTWRIARRARGS